MLKHELLRDDGILVLKPDGALEAPDFERVARELDPYIEEQGDLRGLLIQAESFPGWDDFAAFISHLRFIRDHHHHIVRVAAVSDSAFLSIAPRIAGYFVNAEVRHFEFASRDAAIAWLRDAPRGGDDST